MDYKKVYKNFIANRRLKEPELIASGVYVERHHITPKSLGGDNSPANIIALTAIDHLRSHNLLAVIYGGRQWSALSLIGKGFVGRRRKKMPWGKKDRLIISKLRAAAARNSLKGKYHYNYGKKMPDKTRRILSNVNKQRAADGQMWVQLDPERISGDNHWTRKKTPEELLEYHDMWNRSLKKAAEANIGENNVMHRPEVKEKHRIGHAIRRKNKTGSYSEDACKKRMATLQSAEYKEKMSMRVLGENNPMFGMTGSSNPNSRRFVCVETGQTFDSAKAAKEWCGVEINRACSRGIRAGGYHWKRIGKESPLATYA